MASRLGAAAVAHVGRRLTAAGLRMPPTAPLSVAVPGCARRCLATALRGAEGAEVVVFTCEKRSFFRMMSIVSLSQGTFWGLVGPSPNLCLFLRDGVFPIGKEPSCVGYTLSTPWMPLHNAVLFPSHVGNRVPLSFVASLAFTARQSQDIHGKPDADGFGK